MSSLSDDPTPAVADRLAKLAWESVLVVGLCSLVVGVLALVWPRATLIVIGVLFGVYLLVSGVLQIVAAFGTHVTAAIRVLAFISGALSILLGLLCFRGEMQSILFLGLWIGIGWLFRGVTQTTASIADRAMPARGWQIFMGIVTALAGIVLMVSPLASVALLVLFGGFWLVVLGIVEIITAFRIRSAAKRLAASG
ncbi:MULTISPECIES: HdeD family acid-resistance protein [Saccharopolyspora]|uniref:HdeD family acid-resistance protein n=1 Tax=Saccharopolyspora elongata TaxID=2530387 RepID=A0A4R4YAX3_9PSEU|nr:HdeD family acid-resistance protein [Saccharopolyspora elongata]TDD41190.1 HdeD family acid-resistance protein [Saccharopolyspora elongata]